MKVIETAADLAIALAVISSVRDVPVNPGTAVFGELGLSGEVRPVSQPDRRIQEVGRLGLTTCVVPGGPALESPKRSLQLVQAATLRQAISGSMSRSRSKSPVGAI